MSSKLKKGLGNVTLFMVFVNPILSAFVGGHMAFIVILLTLVAASILNALIVLNVIFFKKCKTMELIHSFGYLVITIITLFVNVDIIS